MRLYLILILSVFAKISWLSAQELPTERLTIENGLSQGMIFDICQTRDGFLWIATKDGLNRYDGYNFKVFSNDPFDPYSLAENIVTTLFEDSRGWLWVGTENKGVDVFDPETGRAHHFSLNFEKTYLTERVAISRIHEAPDGSIWVLKDDVGLIRIAIPEAWKKALPEAADLAGLTAIVPFANSAMTTTADRIINFYIRSDKELLVTTMLRQFTLNPENAVWTPVNEGITDGPQLIAFVGNENGQEVLWFMDNHVITRLYKGVLRTFAFPLHLSGQRRLAQNANSSHVWIAIGSSVWNISPEEGVDFSKPDYHLPEQASRFTYDSNGNLWIGTLGYGIYKIYPAKKRFHSAAAGNSVSGIWRSGQGRYYLKNYLSIIYEYDPVSDKIGKKSAFPDAGINQEALIFDRSGNTWILSSDDIVKDHSTLRCYDPAGRFIRQYELKTRLSHREQLYFCRDGKLLITLGFCKFIRFDIQNGQQESFDFTQLFGDKSSTVRINAIAEDDNGILWLGTQLGLVKCTPKNQSFDYQIIQADSKNPDGLNNNSIACVLVDPVQPKQVLWIGTKGGGINRFDIQTQTCSHITTKDGLPNNVVYGILPDHKNNLWCSTNRGLAKLVLQPGIQPLAFDITAFTIKMGLQDNEFNTSAYYKADNGELIFGGVNGFNRFFPNELQQDTTAPPVFVVGLEINHIPAENKLYGPVEKLRSLELNYDQNNLSFEFAALDFTDPGRNRYRYQLVGLDEDWVETGAGRFAHFSHLTPGHYELRVQGSNGESEWRSAQNTISIRIYPPWWRSNLAYACYLALLCFIAWKFYQEQIGRVKMQQELAFGQREAERIRTVEQMKTNFFNNITHEFRTPLTLIIEPLRQLLIGSSDVWRPTVQLAEANSRKLLGLVNQLLDIAKLESGSMSLDLRYGDIRQSTRSVIETFLPLASQRGVKLSLQAGEKLSFNFDPGRVELVLNNLISNALKFTPAGGSVLLTLRAEHDEEGHAFAVIEVRDNGIGIPEEAQEKVFERFYQVETPDAQAGGGTGIGLSLSRELAQLMGGEITLTSAPGKGSSFSFRLPATTVKTAQTIQTDANGIEALKETTASPLSAQGVALVIEDNAELRSFIRQTLSTTGWQIAEASDGEEGLRKAQEILPDIVISDIMMPQKDGYAVCKELKTNELTAHIPVILLTARSGVDSKIKALEYGADDYLTKPFHGAELLARMQNLVVSRRALREQYSRIGHSERAALTDQASEFVTQPDRDFLRKFTLLLEQHLGDESIGVEELARMMSVSRMQLHRKLTAITDQSTAEYIRRYRLERAMSLLKNGEGNVGQVARMVGFGQVKYFSKVFKEQFGISPSDVSE